MVMNPVSEYTKLMEADIMALEPPAPPEPAAGIPASTSAFFGTHLRTEKQEPYELTGGWEYLVPLLNDDSDEIVITKGRQVGASTYMVGKIIHNAMRYPNTMHAFLSDTASHARDWARIRFHTMLRGSGLAPERGSGKNLVMEVRFPNGSLVKMLSAQDEYKQAQSYSIDFLYLDEAHATEIHALGALQEGMSKSRYRRTIIAGIGAPQGTAWHEKWLSSTMQEWDGSRWVPQNPGADITGYHIPQSMMPYISDTDLSAKLRKYGQAVYDMHVMGLFSAAASTPLTAAEARACYAKADGMIPPTRKHPGLPVYATLDLAHSDDEGGAKTCLTISQYDAAADTARILAAYPLHDSRNPVLYDKITRIIENYAPDHFYADSGGNIDLLQRLRSKYTITSIKAQRLERAAISYDHLRGEDMLVTSKSYFLERVFARFQERRIVIPDCPDLVPWTIEHATADTSELVEPKGATPYTRYERLPNRQDDFLQTLAFLETAIYASTDENNPANRVFAFGSHKPIM